MTRLSCSSMAIACLSAPSTTTVSVFPHRRVHERLTAAEVAQSCRQVSRVSEFIIEQVGDVPVTHVVQQVIEVPNFDANP